MAELVRVELGDRSYDIVIDSGCLDQAGVFAAQRCEGRRALVVTDQNVAGRYLDVVAESLAQAGFDVCPVTLRPGESQKSLTCASGLYDRMAEFGLDRKCLVVALGGGVIGDLAGFAAATYMRGVAMLQIPTSLLAQVDSAVGGKVAVNHPRAKNMIGAFHQPRGVLIDVRVLTTLPPADFRSGLGEVVKHGAILDAAFFEYLEQHVEPIRRLDPACLMHVVAENCRLKAQVVQQDETESGHRAILNYGHTLGHALDAVAGYGHYRHGETVALGMVFASALAERLGMVGPEVTARQKSLLAALGLPTELGRVDAPAVVSAMHLDKKSVGGQLRLVLPRAIGAVEVNCPVSDEVILEVLGASPDD